jgi:hypothetical protein
MTALEEGILESGETRGQFVKGKRPLSFAEEDVKCQRLDESRNGRVDRRICAVGGSVRMKF